MAAVVRVLTPEGRRASAGGGLAVLKVSGQQNLNQDSALNLHGAAEIGYFIKNVSLKVERPPVHVVSHIKVVYRCCFSWFHLQDKGLFRLSDVQAGGGGGGGFSRGFPPPPPPGGVCGTADVYRCVDGAAGG